MKESKRDILAHRRNGRKETKRARQSKRENKREPDTKTVQISESEPSRKEENLAVSLTTPYQDVKVVRGVGENVRLDVQQCQVLENDLFVLGALLRRICVVKAHNELALVLVRKVLQRPAE